MKVIEAPESDRISEICLVNKNILLTGDYNAMITQWKIQGDNLILISKKEKAHNDAITSIVKIGDGYIASGSWDKTIKIW